MTGTVGALFYWALNMSIAACVAGGVVCLFRLIRPLPRQAAAWLWAAPYARMCLPVELAAPVSLMRLLSLLSAKTVTVFQPKNGVEFSMLNTVGAAASYYPFTFQTDVLGAVFGVAGWIWLAGVALLLGLFAAVYIGTVRALRHASPLGDGVYTAPEIKNPAVYGIFRPKILLPEERNAETESCILLHERALIRRRDNLRRLIALALTAAHWFNPLAWLFLKLYLSDLELAADERATADLNAEEKKAYAKALVAAAPAKAGVVSPFGGAGLRQRVVRVLSYRRLTATSVLFFSLLAGTVLFCLLTNAN